MTSRKRYLPEMVYRNWVSASRSELGGIEAHSSPVSSVSHTLDSASFDSGLDTGANLSQSMQTSPSLSTTLHSQSSLLGSRPPALPGTPRVGAGDAMRFKPISDSGKPEESSASFRSDASDSFVSHPSEASVKSPGWSPRLQEPVDSYKVKSASDTHLHGGASSFMKKLQQGQGGQGQGQGGDGADKVTTPRWRLEPPWSLSDHDRPAKTSTPRGRGWSSRPGGPAKLSPGFGRRAFSLSPDKGRKSADQPPPPLQSLSPLLPSPLAFSSSSLHGRGAASSSLLVAAASAGGVGGGRGHDVVHSRLVGGGAERAALLLTMLLSYADTKTLFAWFFRLPDSRSYS